MKKRILDYLKSIRGESIRYLIIGGCTTVVSLVSFKILVDVLGVHYMISDVISVALAILFAYVTNKLVVFRSHCENLRELAIEFVKFVLSRIGTLVIELAFMHLFVAILGMDEQISKLIVQVPVVVGNYFVGKFLVFRKKKKDPSPEVSEQ